ncbi:breast carcinoma-amplified sequence 1 isoform 1-T1 [Fundulus diaphanus]
MGNEQSTIEEVTENGTIPEKHENGSVNGISASITSNGLEIDVKSDITVHQNGELPSPKLETEAEPDNVTVEPDAQPAPAEDASEVPDTPANKEPVKKRKEKNHGFSKLFKKKADRKADDEKAEVREKENEIPSKDQLDASQLLTDVQQETADAEQESEPVTEPEIGATTQSSPEEETVPESENGNGRPAERREESDPEENPVMNFFKTLVTPTKTPKKETAAPDGAKDQSLKETPPAATTTVAQTSEQPAVPKGMPAPPPPPPEPPKLETKGEPAAKAVKPTQKEEPKASAKDPESSKGKSALSKFFRPKTVKEEAQPAFEVEPVVEVQEKAAEAAEPVVELQVEAQDVVEEVAKQAGEEEKVDPSKTGTLEAAAKPEPPPPVQEEKKQASKSSFMSLFKPKVLLDTMTTKVQAASTSGVRLLKRSTGLAAEPKKTTPTPPAAAESPQPAKAKEEPKAAAKSSEAVVDSKPASAASPAGDDAASAPKKLEKRNSIQLFFKTLGQKRHSTDAGVQTEPATAATASEKTK